MNSFGRELGGLVLLPKPREVLNGSSPEELNKYFAAVSIFSQVADYSHSSCISSASETGFQFRRVTSILA